MTLAGIPAGTAQGHALVKRYVIADLGGFADHDAHAVVDEKTATDARPRVDLDTGHPATEVGDQPREPLPAVAPQNVRKAVQPDGMHARIAGQHLKGVARSRVTMEYALNVFSQTLEHY